MDAKTRNLALLAGLSLFCAGVAGISGNFVCFELGLYRARCGRRSRHSRKALGLTWTKITSRSSAPQFTKSKVPARSIRLFLFADVLADLLEFNPTVETA